jgi:cystathionine beta-lyase/cystathionine gamma-synthase
VMHSSTKFLGGHSDMLGGVLVVKDAHVAEKVCILEMTTHEDCMVDSL